MGRAALRSQLGGAGIAALGCAAWLAVTGTPLVLLFAAAGLATGILYGPLRDRGLGPIVILALYGPLIVEGALHAFAVGAHHLDHVALLRWTLVPGALAAATLYLDDLADAPLDEAGGKRTLAVRLPRRSQGVVYTGLLSIGLAPLLALVRDRSLALATLVVALAGLALAVQVRRALEDPRRLAPARLGTQALHAAATLVVVLAVGGSL
jgi:1,4-dihydroxy-2-naphthoate octaprenyltransferase